MSLNAFDVTFICKTMDYFPVPKQSQQQQKTQVSNIYQNAIRGFEAGALLPGQCCPGVRGGGSAPLKILVFVNARRRVEAG